MVDLNQIAVSGTVVSEGKVNERGISFRIAIDGAHLKEATSTYIQVLYETRGAVNCVVQEKDRVTVGGKLRGGLEDGLPHYWISAQYVCVTGRRGQVQDTDKDTLAEG
jgi:hypothetical protein